MSRRGVKVAGVLSVFVAGVASWPLAGALIASDSDANTIGDSDPDPAVYDLELNRFVTALELGDPGDVSVPGNYGGDERLDFAVFTPSEPGGGTATWDIVINDMDASTATYTVSLGSPGDIPAPGDFDGDGLTDPAVFRPSNSTWYWKKSSASPSFSGLAVSVIQSAAEPGDIPAPGFYDSGDARVDFAVFRPSAATNNFLVKYNTVGGTGSTATYTVGDAFSIPAVADFDGDGITDPAVFERTPTGTSTAGTYRWLQSDSSFTEDTFDMSASNLGGNYIFDVPAPGDHDGDGDHDYGVWRPAIGRLFFDKNGSGWGVLDLGDDNAIAAQVSTPAWITCANPLATPPWIGDSTGEDHIAFLGDSITHRSCRALHSELEPLGMVSGVGAPGAITLDALTTDERLDDAADTYAAITGLDHIVINLGTNDVLGTAAENEILSGTGNVGDAEDYMTQLVSNYTGITGVCIHLVNLNETMAADSSSEAEYFNEHLDWLDTTSSYASVLRVVDWNDEVQTTGESTYYDDPSTDDIHPNAVGQRTLADLIAASVSGGC